MARNPKDYQITLRVIGEVYDSMVRLSDRMDVPYSQLIRYSLKKFALDPNYKIERTAVLATRSPNSPIDGQVVFRMAKVDKEKLNEKAKKMEVTPIDLIRFSVLKYLEELKRAA